MSSASYQLSSDTDRAVRRRRIAALLAAIALHLLVLLWLLKWAPPSMRIHPPEGALTTFDITPTPAVTHQPTPRPRAVSPTRRPSGGKAAPPPSPTAPPPTAAQGEPVELLPIDLAGSDISKLPSHHAEQVADAGQGEGTGSGSGKDTPFQSGPGGERLYDVAWYRKPTNAELSGYLPPNAPRSGWGEVRCRMIADYRVEDCSEFGESPPGSGFARSLRQAAWQFRVLPPRVGGHPLLGTWVLIHIDWSGIPTQTP